jgi:hypothetical protein
MVLCNDWNSTVNWVIPRFVSYSEWNRSRALHVVVGKRQHPSHMKRFESQMVEDS